MATLKVYTFPDPILTQRAQPVKQIDRSYFSLFDDLLETQYDSIGCGLAAPQVGILERILVYDSECDYEPLQEKNSHAPPEAEVIRNKFLVWNKKPKILINPQIIAQEGFCNFEEGCLSVPNTRGKVKRALKIRIQYQDVEGLLKVKSCEGLEAIIIQHEIDHLNGTLFIQHLSRNKRQEIQKRLFEEKRKLVESEQKK